MARPHQLHPHYGRVLRIALKAWARQFGRMRHRTVTILGLILAGTVSLLGRDDQAVFDNFCAACHGSDGRAKTPQGKKLKAKDLAVSQLTDTEIERQITEGTRVKKGNSVMPPMGKDMSAAEVAAATRIVKSFRVPARQVE